MKKAKECIETIDKYSDIADKWDKKIFGKTKFQQEHRTEKWEYDNAVESFKDCGVRNKIDLRNQERTQENNITRVQPKLESEKVKIAQVLNVLNGALQALENALRAERYQQRKEISKSNRASRNKSHDYEMEL